MKIPSTVRAWCVEQGTGEIVQVKAVGGGCINNGARLMTRSGASYFLKVNATAPTDMFQREAEGLQALAVDNGPRVPKPILAEPNFLLLEDLQPALRSPGYWRVFGQQLARLHQHTHTAFGFDHDNYIGSTPQPNPWTEDGYVFFAESRLLFQARLAQEKGLLQAGDARRVERIANRLPDLIPEQPASLLHGDLWSGNATSDSDGQPAIIDPAAHYGWAEAELGMTTLFGAFSEAFYQAYEETHPLHPGWRQRLPIYNLYHLLNHVNLFGSGYLGQVRSILRHFV